MINLTPDTTKLKQIRNILLGFGLLFFWTWFIFDMLFPFLKGIVLYEYIVFDGFIPNIYQFTLYKLFMGVAWAPVWETFAFVVLPITIAKRFDDKLVLPCIGLSILLFGWGHQVVSPQVGLMVQGVMGGVFCWVYIKNNYSYWSAVILHMLWNGFLDYLTYLDYK